MYNTFGNCYYTYKCLLKNYTSLGFYFYKFLEILEFVTIRIIEIWRIMFDSYSLH